jgi:hypothetical protein
MVTMINRPSAPPSHLTDGWHPAYLLHISEEATPGDWQMHAQSPTMWRWHCAVWEKPDTMQQDPEVQSGLTSTKFSPKGRYQASKAYTWACALLGRTIAAGESIAYDPLYPLPCRIKTVKEPGKDFVKVTDVESWSEGGQALASIKEALLRLRATIMQQPPPVIPPVAPQPPAPSQAPAPAPVPQGLQTWGSVQQQTPAPTTPPKW